jgi:hypothetical protein
MYGEAVLKQTKIINLLSLLLNIYISVGSVLSILDNDVMRHVINGDFEYKPAFWFGLLAMFYDFITLITINVVFILYRCNFKCECSCCQVDFTDL